MERIKKQASVIRAVVPGALGLDLREEVLKHLIKILPQ